MRLIPRIAPLLLLAAALLGAAPAAPRPVEAQAPHASWSWPLEPRPAVVHPFDPPERPWLSGHRGVDLAASAGATVRAPAQGTVVFVGWVVDRPVVTIDHGDGLRSSFEPLSSPLEVGAEVEKEAPLGTLGPAEAGHCAPAACVHWGVRRGDEYIDPLQFVEDRRPSVLLPWAGPQ
ncbi:M23 family metallopeptidase [Sinomonas atrocyanea]|uniref:M23 family metallopeptidase n=1 Tax=Sinomonas atrocyanea TaxID=37927 RepID=UPI003D96351B